MNPDKDIKEVKEVIELAREIQITIERTLGSDFISGECSREERASKTALATAGTTAALQKLVALTLLMKFQSGPKQDQAKFTEYCMNSATTLTLMLQERMGDIVNGALEDIIAAAQDISFGSIDTKNNTSH